MAASRKRPARTALPAPRTVDPRVGEVLAWLARRGTRRNREGMARYGIVMANDRVFGVSMETCVAW
jgi:hypothetical protein